MFLTKLIDKYVCYASKSNYFLNSFSSRNFQDISQNTHKFKSLPIGMNINRIKEISSSFSCNRSAVKVIGIYSNFYYYEHQYFINKFINLIYKNHIETINQNYIFNISGIYSEEILKKELLNKTYFSKLFKSNGAFNSLVSWLGDVDSLIIPFFTTCGIKIKLLEAIASCKPVMVNQSIIEHLPEGFDELFPSLFIYKELSINSLNKFLNFSNSYYSSEKYLENKSNLNQLNWENMINFENKKR